MIRRVPHCSHWGAYTILVEDGRIVGVEPSVLDPAPSPTIQAITEWVKPDRRVLRPLVREGWLSRRDRNRDGGDHFVAVPWDEALDMAAGEIARVVRDHGNDAIFAGSYGWTSCGRFHHASSQLKRMLNLVGGFTGHVDTYSIAAGPVILRHVLGEDSACNGQATTLDNIAEHTQTLVVFGALSPRTAQCDAGGIGGHYLETYLQCMAERGVKIILISPLREDMPEGAPAEWWPIRPNTDTALMLGLAGEIVKVGRQDNDFLTRCTSGAEEFLSYLRGDSDGQIKDADWAAAITGLPAQGIRTLATRLVQTRSMLSVSWALQRAHHGEQPFWAALGLAAIIGQIGLPGGGVGYGYGSVAGLGMPFSLTPSPRISQGEKPNDSHIPVSRISDMLLHPGGTYPYQGELRTYPDIRLVYWAGGNPFHHHQDLGRLSKAWARPETIIVQDPMMTATARRADIILPASTSLERNDLSGNKRSDVILAMAQAIAPLGQARSDFAIFDGLAERLGVGAAFNEGRDEMGWLRHIYEECRQTAAQDHGFQMPDFDQFWQQGYAPSPMQRDHIYLAEFRAAPQAHPLNTESGRIVLGSKALARLDYDDIRPHPAWLEPAEWLGNGADQQLHLLSHQPEGRLHSQLETSDSSLAARRNGREQVRLHPDDAAAREIVDGQTVRLWNDRGACLATAMVSDGVARGVAILPTGAWLTPVGNSGLDIAGNPNVLTLDIGSSRFGQGCSAQTCLVRVEPHAPDARDAVQTYQAQLSDILPE